MARSGHGTRPVRGGDPGKPDLPAAAHDLTVSSVGAAGDGRASLPSGDPVYLPFTLPGERVSVPALARRGDGWTGTATVLAPSPERRPAPCPHFGTCGGCTLQHWDDKPYAGWKAAQLAGALTRAGFPGVAIGPLARTPPGARRRVDLALVRTAGGVAVGLHRHRSQDVVDLATCLVLAPPLVALVGHLRRALPGIAGLRRGGSAVANLLDGGIDLLLRLDAAVTAADRAHLTAFAAGAGVCRVSVAHGAGAAEPAALLHPANVSLAGVAVTPAAGAFLQASREGEAAITAAVLDGLPRALPARSRIVELFAGSGTLSFALATRARVLAFEGDGPASAALQRAAAGRRIDAVTRDLVRQPLSAKEMAGAAAIVLDPPYAGAGPQMAAIAASGAPVIYVNCNPAALARDARVLAEAGFSVGAATPIDQFLWSASVESVVVFAPPPSHLTRPGQARVIRR